MKQNIKECHIKKRKIEDKLEKVNTKKQKLEKTLQEVTSELGLMSKRYKELEENNISLQAAYEQKFTYKEDVIIISDSENES